VIKVRTIKVRTRDGMKVAGRRGDYAGRSPSSAPRQEQHHVALHAASGHTSAELAELFCVARSTVYRAPSSAPPLPRWSSRRHSGAVNSDDLADATRAAKATEALLRDARSALRRVEKLTDAALATDDADAHRLAGAAQRMLEQLVDHLVLAKQKRNREVQRALRQLR
jgi:ribosomal protein S20